VSILAADIARGRQPEPGAVGFSLIANPTRASSKRIFIVSVRGFKMNDGTERTNLQLNCTLSAGLWAILQEHSRKTNEPVSHIVSLALAEYFQVSHTTLYQVSTATALVEGIYQGAVRVRPLREHGDLGLGTFENLDGEMMIVDGHFFQARSDGLVKQVDNDILKNCATHRWFTAMRPAGGSADQAGGCGFSLMDTTLFNLIDMGWKQKCVLIGECKWEAGRVSCLF
jgi:hypothetical protein